MPICKEAQLVFYNTSFMQTFEYVGLKDMKKMDKITFDFLANLDQTSISQRRQRLREYK